MTTRDYFVAVLNAHISDEMDAVSQEFIAKMNARNEKRKSPDSKEKRETASRRETVFGLLSETPAFAESIAESSGLTVGQVRSALSTLVREGKASKAEVKDGKSRKMAYAKA